MNAPLDPPTLEEQEAFRREVIAYVGFDAADSERLARLVDPLAHHFTRFAQHFYDRIDAHPDARAAITGGEEQVERLKRTLVDWMRSGLVGPHDAAFFERRRRIGRVHVEIGLPQRFMFTAMNVMRSDFHTAIDALDDEELRDRQTRASLDRLFDLELAIMLESYAEASRRRLEAAQRMSTIGQLASGIGHELRNPIGVIASSLYLLGRRLPPDDGAQRHIQKMTRSVGACESIISNLMELARDRPLRAQAVDLCELVARVVDSTPRLAGAQIDCRDDCARRLVGDPGLLERVLANLLLNAAEADGGPSPRIQVRAFATDEGCGLLVRDFGPGFPEDLLVDAFEPLVTRRSGGTGLGLALVRRIVERHMGRVEARNAEDPRGAIVEIILPVPKNLRS